MKPAFRHLTPEPWTFEPLNPWTLKPPPKIVLSASRRTDIPAFYMPWFMERIKSGVFEVVNPFNRRVKKVPATPTDVHTIVFWSKNFGLFLKEGYGHNLQKAGYNLFFNFTINSYAPRLEPHVPHWMFGLNSLNSLAIVSDPELSTGGLIPSVFLEPEKVWLRITWMI